MARNFSVPSGGDVYLTFAIAEPALRAQGLSLQTWTSSLVLARLLHKIAVDFSSPTPVPVLELGAGTGLVGLSAAALWKVPVILTDLPPFVSGLAGNVNLNAATVKDSVLCGSLDWSEPDSLILQDGSHYKADKHPARIILAADTVYSEEHPELLSRTILKWLAPGPSSRAILTYPLRVAYLDQIRELWDLLEAGGLEAIMDGQEQDDDVHDWDDECLCEWSVWRWKQDGGRRERVVGTHE
ncbi:putative glucose-inducible SAM-dependent methyltransferase Rrg1 [Cladophialophora carrionii]|uniref:Putative glucose-inducible SAM-dependent methyltransferase Rrg1 n=1 Tax=Cladophialophora carrionii TaxID=86049 RepID=A0A1C1CQY2_9EURO|nr:putative glucose-inducible SAM-dependent methyltransferase Rrg1 [Cladophialophora carrionii]